MTIRRILQSKGATGVLTIRPGDKVSDAARVLSEKRIGALIVSKDGNTIDGILSERDIVRELGKRGAGCLGDLVSDLMTKTVTAIDPDQLPSKALEMMTSGRFRHMPVVEKGKMIGVISIGDVVKYRIEEVERENQALTEMITGHG